MRGGGSLKAAAVRYILMELDCRLSGEYVPKSTALSSSIVKNKPNNIVHPKFQSEDKRHDQAHTSLGDICPVTPCLAESTRLKPKMARPSQLNL